MRAHSKYYSKADVGTQRDGEGGLSEAEPPEAQLKSSPPFRVGCGIIFI